MGAIQIQPRLRGVRVEGPQRRIKSSGRSPILHMRHCELAGLKNKCPRLLYLHGAILLSKRLGVTEPVVSDLCLLSSARLCTFPIIPPSFSLNSLFRPNKTNISYVYILVDLSLYNTPVFASRSHFSFSLSLPSCRLS